MPAHVYRMRKMLVSRHYRRMLTAGLASVLELADCCKIQL
jgi:hypothetical protein